MGIDSTRILGRQMAQQALSDAEINLISGGVYTASGLSPDSMCNVGTSPGFSGSWKADDCTADPL